MNNLLNDLHTVGDCAYANNDQVAITAYTNLKRVLTPQMLAILEDAPKIEELIRSQDPTASKQLEIQILRTVNRAMRS